MKWAWCYPLALCATVLPFAILYPRAAVALAQQGHGGLAIGFFSMITYLVVFLNTPFMATVYRRMGVNKAFLAGIAFDTLATVGLIQAQGFLAMCLCAVATGIGSSFMWSANETVIARSAPAERLGATTGLYQTLLGMVLACGPFLPGLLALQSQQLLFLSLAMLAFALMLLLLAWWRCPPVDIGEPAPLLRASWPQVLRAMPVLLLAAFVGGVFEAGVSNIGSAQMTRLGLPPGHAVFFAGVVATGSLLMQWPIGRLADRQSPSRLLAISLAGLILVSLLAVAMPGEAAAWWACALVWGALGGALYTLAMISVGKRFRQTSTARFTSVTIAAYTAGCVSGPFLAGAAYDWAPARGIAVAMACLAAMALGGLALTRHSLPHRTQGPG